MDQDLKIELMHLAANLTQIAFSQGGKVGPSSPIDGLNISRADHGSVVKVFDALYDHLQSKLGNE